MRNWIFPQLIPQQKESILYLRYTLKTLDCEPILLRTLLKETDMTGPLFRTLPFYGTR